MAKIELGWGRQGQKDMFCKSYKETRDQATNRVGDRD